MESLAKFFEFLNVPLKYVIGAFVVSAILIFAPDGFLRRLGLLSYREEGKPYFALLLAILAVLIVGATVSPAIERSSNCLRIRAIKKQIKFLSTEERLILWKYIEGQTKTVNLGINSGVVGGLVRAGFIYNSSQVAVGGYAFAYNIQPWAWEYFNKHRDLLRVHTHEVT